MPTDAVRSPSSTAHFPATSRSPDPRSATPTAARIRSRSSRAWVSSRYGLPSSVTEPSLPTRTTVRSAGSLPSTLSTARLVCAVTSTRLGGRVPPPTAVAWAIRLMTRVLPVPGGPSTSATSDTASAVRNACSWPGSRPSACSGAGTSGRTRCSTSASSSPVLRESRSRRTATASRCLRNTTVLGVVSSSPVFGTRSQSTGWSNRTVTERPEVLVTWPRCSTSPRTWTNASSFGAFPPTSANSYTAWAPCLRSPTGSTAR